MSYPTIKKISLDIYNNLIVGFNAKQGDIGSRYVEITATENGKKIVLDAESVKVYIRYKKADGKVGLVNGTVQDDGTIIFEITQQMLAASGRCNFDVILADATGYINVDGKGRLVVTDTSVISTMPFYINVLSSTFDDSMIESSNDFPALKKAINDNIALEKSLNENEAKRQKDFEDKIDEWDSEVDKKIDEWKSELDTKIGEWKLELDGKIDKWKLEFDGKVTEWKTELDTKIDAWKLELDSKIVGWKSELDEKVNAWKSEFDGKVTGWKSELDSIVNTWKTELDGKIAEWELEFDGKIDEWELEFDGKLTEWESKVNAVIKSCNESEALRIQEEKNRIANETGRIQAETDRADLFSSSMTEWDKDVASKISEWDQEVADAESAREDAFDSLKENWTSEVDNVVKSANDAVTTVNTTNETVSQNEEQRIANETARQESETLRQTAETQRQENYDSLIGQINTSVERINNAIGGIIDDESVDLQTTYSSSKITTFDTKDNVISFDSYDVEEGTEWTDVDVLASEEKHSSIFSKISTMFKNIKYIWKMIGQTDISSIGDGTITGTIDMLNNKSKCFNDTYMRSNIYNGVYEIAIQTRYSDWTNDGSSNRQSIFVFGNDNNDMFFGTIQIYNNGTCSFIYNSKTNSVYTVEKSDNGQIILKLPVIIYDHVTAISANPFSLLS